MSETAGKQVSHLKQRQDDRDRQEILDSLTRVDYSHEQSGTILRRRPGTGLWLLRSPEYQQWLHSESVTTLFCPGIPGAGKTILASIAVEDLSNRFSDSVGIGVAWVYCNFRRKDSQSARDILLSLLRQLAQGRPSLPASVVALSQEEKGRRTPPSVDEVSSALRSVASLYSVVFIVIDALDELEIQASDRRRETLLMHVLRLNAETTVKLFATSRHVPDTEVGLGVSLRREILADPEDIRTYLDGCIPDLRKCVLASSELQEEIKVKITSAAEGMYASPASIKVHTEAQGDPC
ncbi:NACHT domain-containing protein [Candidatus Bathyarchaeota archaeon]|nr:NACHT domain-containing protein [Candidatus Bathyarchaeota archaeon]